MLTDNQRADLNAAVYEYLQKNYTTSAEQFRNECSDDVTKTGSLTDVLERKWISIVRLTKRITELEGTVEHLNNELKSVSKMKRTTANAGDTESMFPKYPPV